MIIDRARELLLEAEIGRLTRFEHTAVLTARGVPVLTARAR